ncbi:hypothetical protein BKA70DRAFT_1308480 [Coprinopsis sp. MPI-PUGE-AT-0042]|nr:hypothetical protein BKA70DRAFT_1308480 [Coprinopsis sp. MPI-PUGE-AT-0042]
MFALCATTVDNNAQYLSSTVFVVAFVGGALSFYIRYRIASSFIRRAGNSNIQHEAPLASQTISLASRPPTVPNRAMTSSRNHPRRHGRSSNAVGSHQGNPYAYASRHTVNGSQAFRNSARRENQSAAMAPPTYPPPAYSQKYYQCINMNGPVPEITH